MFDPNLPLENTEIAAPEMRSQLQGLFALIQAVPAGPQGIPGQDGNSVAGALVDAVNTLNPGDAVQVTVSYDGTNLHFSFSIPRGNDGGSGGDGPPGPPFTNFIIDAVNMLNPGDTPSAFANFDGSAVRLTFNIPRGFQGDAGSQGPPGEVSMADLNNATAGVLMSSSQNSNSVSTLDFPFADPDSETLRQKLNELIAALRR